MAQLLQERANVVADFRKPDVLRLGFAPIYTRFVDVWDGFDRLRGIAAEVRHPTTSKTELPVR